MKRIPTVKLSLPSHPIFLGLIRMAISQVAKEMQFGKKEVKNIVLAIDEACANVIKYAYQGRYDKRIIITAKDKDDRLEVSIRDFGKKAKPGSLRHRPLKKVRPGGLGIFFIRKIMDEVHYDTSSKIGTTLHLVKYKK